MAKKHIVILLDKRNYRILKDIKVMNTTKVFYAKF